MNKWVMYLIIFGLSLGYSKSVSKGVSNQPEIQREDGYEANDSFGTASLIELNDSAVYLSIHNTGLDNDYFKFRIESDSVWVHLYTQGVEDGDTQISLFDSSYSEVAFNDDNSFDTYSSLKSLLVKGVYYAKVSEYDEDDYLSEYSFYIDTLPNILDIYEPNDSLATATSISLNDSLINMSIDDFGRDVDYFRFELLDTSVIVISTKGEDGGDTELYLYDSLGVLIEYNDDYTTAYSYIRKIMPKGVYYAEVRGYDNEFSISNYSLHLDGFVYSPVADDVYENNDTFSTATQLSLNDSLKDLTLSKLGLDVDYFSFDVSVVSDIDIAIVGLSGDYEIELYDSSFNYLAYSSSAAISSKLAVGTYYIKVVEYEQNFEVPSYHVYLNSQTASSTVLDDRFENNNTMVTSTILSGNDSIGGLSISQTGFDVDYFKITLTSISDVEVSVENQGLDGVLRATIYDSNFYELDYGSNLTMNGLDSGVYFIHVEEVYSDELEKYSLVVKTTNSIILADDIYESNDSIPSATQLSMNDSIQNLNINEFGRDLDYFYFDLASEVEVTVSTSGNSLEDDTYIRLIDSEGYQITSDDDGAYDFYSSFTEVLDSGRYYVEVSQLSLDLNINNYSIHLSGNTITANKTIIPDLKVGLNDNVLIIRGLSIESGISIVDANGKSVLFKTSKIEDGLKLTIMNLGSKHFYLNIRSEMNGEYSQKFQIK